MGVIGQDTWRCSSEAKNVRFCRKNDINFGSFFLHITYQQ